jgi:hypothetical protein
VILLITSGASNDSARGLNHDDVHINGTCTQNEKIKYKKFHRVTDFMLADSTGCFALMNDFFVVKQFCFVLRVKTEKRFY